jgi:cation diffusion facilitator CzcD-associated flavoprotein CzcO
MTIRLKADYLVVGTGAVGMAFVDSLIADSDARVVMVDRRHAPGGHWHDAYPFVRLHQPSAYYGESWLAPCPLCSRGSESGAGSPDLR